MAKLRSGLLAGPWLVGFGLSLLGMSAPELPPPLILALTVDETGTSPHDIERTQELIKTLVAGLPEDTLFVVASFSGEKRIVLPATSDRSKVAAAIAGFTAGRGEIGRASCRERV